MYTFPAESTLTPEGKFNCAEIAGPSSPLYPNTAIPATVPMIEEITPVSAPIRKCVGANVAAV